jgi:hypothetical protein
MDTNLPFTYVKNILVLGSLMINKYHEFILPMSLGTLLTGTIVAHGFPCGVSKKYNLSLSMIRIGDVLMHWIPLILMLVYTSGKVSISQSLIAIVLPLLYFSYKYKTCQVVNPKNHIMETYPDVPLWVFFMYMGGCLLSTLL